MAGTDEMRDLLNRLYDSFDTGDAAAWTAAVAEDVLGVGSDPDEWWEGRDAFVTVVTLPVEQMAAANVQVSPGTPHIFEQGDVMWAVDRSTVSQQELQSEIFRVANMGAAIDEDVIEDLFKVLSS